jgi:hypothetical protein
MLTNTFGCYESTISKMLYATLPYVIAFFASHIPNQLLTNTHSVLSTKIRFILDGTVHKEVKPRFDQHLYFNGDYYFHCISSQILLDYDGYIVNVETGM